MNAALKFAQNALIDLPWSLRRDDNCNVLTSSLYLLNQFDFCPPVSLCLIHSTAEILKFINNNN